MCCEQGMFLGCSILPSSCPRPPSMLPSSPSPSDLAFTCVKDQQKQMLREREGQFEAVMAIAVGKRPDN